MDNPVYDVNEECYHVKLSKEEYQALTQAIHRDDELKEKFKEHPQLKHDINKAILKLLRDDCHEYPDMWRYSIYGEVEGTNEEGEYAYHEIDYDFVKRNYCATNPRCSRFFCDACRRNFTKIARCLHDSEHDLNWLVEHWNEAPCSGSSPAVKEIQSEESWKQKHPDFFLDVKWSVKTFDSYFDTPLDEYIPELQQYDIIDLGWHFNQSVEPLLQCKKLKGLIFGYWFRHSLNSLSELPELQFIQVRYSYNCELNDKIYDLTYR